VLVISDALWRRRFGASPSAIGRKLRIDHDWYTVVGVLPPGFRHPGRSVLTDVDVWAPANSRRRHFQSRRYAARISSPARSDGCVRA